MAESVWDTELFSVGSDCRSGSGSVFLHPAKISIRIASKLAISFFIMHYLLVLDLLNYTDQSRKLQHSARKLMVPSDSFVDTAIENFKESILIHLGIKPMGGTIVVAAILLIYGMAAEDTPQIHFIRYFL